MRKFIAICNKTNFDGHYVKEFDCPDEYAGFQKPENGRSPGNGWNRASWYFLNVVDFTACIEAVYPLDIFEKENRLVGTGADHTVATILDEMREGRDAVNKR